MKKSILILLIIILLTIIVQDVLDSQSERKELTKLHPFATLPPTEYLGAYLGSVVLGGFKPLIVDYLWIKADKLQRDHLYEEMLVLMKLIARLQPYFVEVWDFNSYLMAYNISRGHTKEKEWGWIKAGIDYAHEGLSWNPGHHKLYFSLANLFFHRIPQADYLLDEVEKEYKCDTYEKAEEYYRELILKSRQVGKDAYGWEPMVVACRFCHSFELVKKGRFDQAREALVNLADKCQEILQVYNKETSRWEKEREQFLALSQIIESEKRCAALKEAGLNHFFDALPELLAQYQKLLEQYARVLYMSPIEKRIEQLFLEYIKEAYELVRNQDFQACHTLIEQAVENVVKIIPADPNHLSRDFLVSLRNRLVKFDGLTRNEQVLSQTIAANNIPSALSELEKTLNEYRSYLATYGDYFNLRYEYERYHKLKERRKKLR